MKNNKLLVMALSLILCFTVGIGIAVAYFTDYEAAKGGAVLNLSGRTEIEEAFDGNDKLVTITNVSEDDVDMVVRVMAFGENLQYSPETAGDWVKGNKDNVWYYTKVLKKGESTSQLKVHVEGITKPVTDPEDPIDLEVTVVHEAERVIYTQDDEGNNVVAAPSGWDGFPVIAAESDGE